ncbi:hypothetical protein OG792_21025 [Micromonospora sp. NBC_01699]|uniref:hypothetical protein n=1 Tax=Micromonospora sp. NBC_01699 TaxID=2975984 RepID=UPI002E2E688B|nr:hypothetical protein [Micromonospora sp. NBC_01699]
MCRGAAGTGGATGPVSPSSSTARYSIELHRDKLQQAASPTQPAASPSGPQADPAGLTGALGRARRAPGMSPT